MNTALHFVLKHGYSVLFAALFAHQIGLPVPGPLFLLPAGALAADGKLGIFAVVVNTVTACVLADWIWYEAGRRRGEKVLHFLHRFTSDPDFHDRRAKETFARYGLSLLLIFNFVPGLGTVLSPLAGISRTSRARFLVFDTIGAGLYVGAYVGLGYYFSNDLDRAAAILARAKDALVGLALAAICIYIAHKLAQRNRLLRESRFLRIVPADPVACGNPVGMPSGEIGGQENGD